MNPSLLPLIEEFRAAWLSGISMDSVLTRFVELTHARASGCWRLEDGHLLLAGFGWASDMPDEVSRGFQDATRRVSLDQTSLGIVKAAIKCEPAVGRRDPGSSGLSGSASWIAKFAAQSSLAVPICDQPAGAVAGVFAVSTASQIHEGDSLWQTMLGVARELGRGR